MSGLYGLLRPIHSCLSQPRPSLLSIPKAKPSVYSDKLDALVLGLPEDVCFTCPRRHTGLLKGLRKPAYYLGGLGIGRGGRGPLLSLDGT